LVDAASFILGAEPEAIRRLPGIALAESALHAPFASFGGVDGYPTLIEQAAVLLEHLARNHPLPDGNKRVAFLPMARFLDANGVDWGGPDVDTDAGIVERVAAGDASHEQVIAWIEGRTESR
jgi:death on curing protein